MVKLQSKKPCVPSKELGTPSNAQKQNNSALPSMKKESLQTSFFYSFGDS